MEKTQLIEEIRDPDEFTKGSGLYETTSQYQAFGVLKALDWHPRVNIVSEMFFPDHISIIARVGDKQLEPKTKQIKANPELTWEFAPDYWPRKLDKYDNWETGWWREVVQNARDASTKNIEMEARLETYKDFWTGEEVEAVRISCADDGTGMDEASLKKAFFTWGGTDKPAGAVGGFGDAKELILLPWLGYRIHTRDTIAEGSHNRVKDLRRGSNRTGTLVTVWMPKEKTTTAEFAKAFIERCNLPYIRFTVNGERVKAALGGGDLVREKVITADGREVGNLQIFHAPRSRRRGIYVRANGVFMYERQLSESKYKGVVYIEVNAPPRDTFVQARNGFNSRSSVYWDVESFIEQLAVDPRSTLKKQKADRGKIRQVFQGKKLHVNEGVASEIAAKLAMAVPVPEMKSWKDGGLSLDEEQIGSIVEVLRKEMERPESEGSDIDERVMLFTLLLIGYNDKWAAHSSRSPEYIRDISKEAAKKWIRLVEVNRDDPDDAVREVFNLFDGSSQIDMKWSYDEIVSAYGWIGGALDHPSKYTPTDWTRVRPVVEIIYRLPQRQITGGTGVLTQDQFNARVAMVLLVAANYLDAKGYELSDLQLAFSKMEAMSAEWNGKDSVDWLQRKYRNETTSVILLSDVELNQRYEELKKIFERIGTKEWPIFPATEAVAAAKNLYDFSTIKRTSTSRGQAPPGEYGFDLKPDAEAIEAMLTDMKFVGADHAMQALRLSAWAPQFLFINEIDYYIPPREVGYNKQKEEVDPTMMSANYRKLARLWSEINRFTLMRLGWSKPFGVGFIFDWDEERQSSTLAAYTREEGLDFLLINPVKLTIQDKRKDSEGDVIDIKYDEKTRWLISDDEHLKMLCAASIHEATHMVNGISRHDESFAAAMTENMGAMIDMLVVAKKIRRALGKRTSK